jgi:hypothetical protein
MSLSLSDLKKSSQKNLNRLIQESEKLAAGGDRQKKGDERFWSPTIDKAGNGFALIRFLPASKVDGPDALPWTMYWDHGFQGPSGKWYIEKSLHSIGQKDPVSEYNTKLWNTNEKDMQDQARKQKRRQHFVSNILVINDPANPENNGRVFLFNYGRKIYEKIKNVMTPDEELGEQPNDPFDFWNGQNFKLKIKNVAGFRNYDDSAFAGTSAVLDNDKKIEDLWDKQFSLKEFTDPTTFKSFNDLKSKLYEVLEINEGATSSAEKMAAQAEKVFEKEAQLEKVIQKSETDEEDLEALLKEFD